MSLIQNEISTWSKDPSTKVAALVVSPDRKLMISGYNGFPRGIDDDPNLLADRSYKYPRTIHAELNAILNSPVPLQGFTLYVTPLSPCCPCSANIIQAGITRVVTDYQFNGNRPEWEQSMLDGIELFKQAGVEYVTHI